MERTVDYDEIFRPGGRLNQVMKEYEFRETQLKMVRLIEKSFSGNINSIIEAGTGTGKTLAYLLPALDVDERVVISTGTKNLQEQIFYKDIPFLKNKLGMDFKAALVKGRGNYLCKRRLLEFKDSGEFQKKSDIDDFALVKTWNRITKTGDIAEVEGLPEEPSFWKEINARGEICLGSRCSFFEDCFISSLRRRVSAAQLILVNHHLLFADRAVKASGYGEVLPEYRYLILDEAHLVESVAAGYFGSRVSDYQVLDLTGDTRKEFKKSKIKGSEIDKKAGAVELNTGLFFEEFRRREERYRIDSLKKSGKAGERYALLRSSLADFNLLLKDYYKEYKELEPLIRRSRDITDHIKKIMESSEPDYVYWAEHTKRTMALNATPIVIKDLIRENLFETLNSAVLTSATLSVAGDFRYTKARLGLRDAKTAFLPSEFDFQSRSMLYIPKDLPLPSEEGFYSSFAERALEILKITKGRAFLLFTSFRGMNETYEYLQDTGEFNLLVQGELGKSELINRFRSGKKMALLGTMSFWQGIDVQGEDLSCVIIDKLPFAVPSEPVVSATIEFLKSRGEDPFNSYQLPNAVMLLKQGLGRLIRHRNDYGIAAVMDRRILSMPYGKVFLESLPPFTMTSKIEELSEFFDSLSKKGN
jgi:ATP-dependent DNA helicase DinG